MHQIQEAIYPGAKEAVRALASLDDCILGIATGKSLRGVERVLGAHDILHHFSTRQTPDTNPSKPNPAMILSAMAETGVASTDTIMIGDTTFDIEMAQKAGVRAIGVDWGYHETDELFAAGAVAVVDSYPTLMEHLRREWEGDPHA